MEISSMTSHFGLETRISAAAAAAATSPSRTTTRTNSRRTLNVSAKFSSGISLTSSNHVSPLFGGGSLTSDFSIHTIRPSPLTSSSFSTSRIKRNVITMVIPFVRGSPWEQTPPDLASYIFRERIVFLGMSLSAPVTELMVASFIYLDYEDAEKPIYFYINSTGVSQEDDIDGFLQEAFVVYDCMSFTKPPIYTLAIGNAWGEAALLLAAGERGHRAALPSASIMLHQPYGRRQGQASSVESLRQVITRNKETLVKLYARHVEKDREQIEKDIKRPKYLSPTEAIEYGIIDKVLYTERVTKKRPVVTNPNKGLF